MGREIKVLVVLVFGVFFCFGRGSESSYIVHPPILDIEEDFIDIQTNSTLVINCIGKSKLAWETPPKTGPPENDTRLNIVSSVNNSESIYKHKSTLTLQNADFLDTGFYKCFYDGKTSTENFVSLYVFVNDPVHLFVDKPLRGFYALQQSKRSVIPCRPTNSKANVTLWNVENEPEEEVRTQPLVMSFDPRFGFVIDYPVYEMGGDRQCRAVMDGIVDTFDLTLRFYVDSDPPQPFINMSSALHPVVNSTFVLTCTVEVELDTAILGFYWYYPNKHHPEDRINETRAVVGWTLRNGNRYQEISKSLTVRDARSNDSGTYTCVVTDHANQTGRYNVSIYVHETQQPAHVNLTTDIDTSKPIETETGQDVKFVITVRAYPAVRDVQFVWEKDGKRLSDNSNHIRQNGTDDSRTLEIRQIVREDAGRYTLRGETVDRNSSISIDLLVKADPLIIVDNAANVYLVGKEYRLDCRSGGYPSPAVRWRWKACPSDDLHCDPDQSGGWRDVDDLRSSNKENVTYEMSSEERFPVMSSMHLAANRSVFYKCVASNAVGARSVVVPFLVTDAVDGFELSVSDTTPVDLDQVELTCRVNTHNYSRIEWTWTPAQKHAVASLPGVFNRDIQLTNTSNVIIFSSTSVYSHVSVVSFEPIRPLQSGEYACRATSLRNRDIHVKTIAIDVRAIRKPVLNSTNMVGGTFRTHPGTRQEFYCRVGEGVPFPHISWLKDGSEVNSTESPGVELGEKGQLLVIRRVMERDRGMYQCVVGNRGGMVEGNATLDIIAGENAFFLTPGEISAIVIVGFSLVALILLISCLVKRIMKDKREQKELDIICQNNFERGYIDVFNPNLPIDSQPELLPYKHTYEFPKERLKLDKTLGQGAFGRVVKAEAIGLVEGEASTTVAVKMLKEAADTEQKKALVAELKILIHIGKHVNIVNLLGAVTKNLRKGELYVIVEYCCYGNLRHFLLKHKESFIDQLDRRTGQLDPQMSTLPGSPPPDMRDNMISYSDILGMGLDNPNYRGPSLHYADLAHQPTSGDSGTGASVLSSEPYHHLQYITTAGPHVSSMVVAGQTDETSFVTTCDLLCFAFQCARGMEYLASRKLIHRDLAARNVLLAADNVVKICDFGLAKDIYKYSNYKNTKGGLLPVKWMAIESIRDRVFTTKSDVWSFGVLLWELFTLGGNPYPGVEINEEFFKKLKNGYRMEKPEMAPDQIDELMRNCWQYNPVHRPDFSQLAETIGSLLESGVRKYYVELNTPYQMMNEELFPNNNDYLQMSGIKEEYTNMVPSEPTKIDLTTEAVPMVRLQTCPDKKRQFSSDDNETNITYLNVASYPEEEEYDSVFLERTEKDKVHYENGDCTSAVPLLVDNRLYFGDGDLHD